MFRHSSLCVFSRPVNPSFFGARSFSIEASNQSKRGSLRVGATTFFKYLAFIVIAAAPILQRIERLWPSPEFEPRRFNLAAYLSLVDWSSVRRITALPLVPTGILVLTLLLLGSFLPHSGEFTRLLHRLGFAYLIFALWRGRSGTVIRYDSEAPLAVLGIGQEDSLRFRLVLLYGTLIVALFFFGVAERFILSTRGEREFPLRILLVHLGSLFALRFSTFRDILLGLERRTLGSYVLATFERQSRFSTYAGVQYFLVGSLPSAILLLSFALFYLQGGSLVLQDLDLLFTSATEGRVGVSSIGTSAASILLPTLLPAYLSRSDNLFSKDNLVATSWPEWAGDLTNSFPLESLLSATNPFTAVTRRALVLIRWNLLFKLTAAPFSLWAPSVYGKAPLASVTFLTIASKARIFFFLAKLLTSVLHPFLSLASPLLLLCGVASVIIGRIGAYSERTSKRFFVYSSIGHVGFRLIGLSLATLEGRSATFHYLAIYVISSFLRWFILLTRGRTQTSLRAFATLRHREPVLARLFGLLLFSRSGIPPLGGFFIKLDLLSSLLGSGHGFVTYTLFALTIASFVYYLRVVKILFFDEVAVGNAGGRIVSENSSTPVYAGRLWLRGLLFLVLSLYLPLVPAPLLYLQQERLSALFL